MNLTHLGYHLISAHQVSSPSGMQIGRIPALGVHLNAHSGEEHFRHSACAEEILALAVETQHQVCGLGGQALLCLLRRIKDAGNLKETGGRIAVVHVEGQRGEHIRNKRCAHHGGILAQGVSDCQKLPARIIRRQVQRIHRLGGDEGIVHDFKKALACQKP